MFDLLFSIISVTLGISEITALHRPDDWANGGGGGTNHSFPRRRAVHFDLLFLSAAVLLFLSNCLRHGIGSFHPRYDVFLILKDLCRFLTDFAPLYRLHWESGHGIGRLVQNALCGRVAKPRHTQSTVVDIDLLDFVFNPLRAVVEFIDCHCHPR